jgi:hypothetical protein
MTIVKSRAARPSQRWWAWSVRALLALPFFGATLWLVVASVPYPRDPGMPTLSIVATAVFVCGLAVEELVGADVRRLLGI